MPKRKLVHITWADSASYDAGWKSHEKVANLDPCYIESVGFVMHETPKFIVLSAHVSEYSATGEMSIPKGCIIKTRRLK